MQVRDDSKKSVNIGDLGIKESDDVNFAVVTELLQASVTELSSLGPSLNSIS